MSNGITVTLAWTVPVDDVVSFTRPLLAGSTIDNRSYGSEQGKVVALILEDFKFDFRKTAFLARHPFAAGNIIFRLKSAGYDIEHTGPIPSLKTGEAPRPAASTDLDPETTPELKP